MKYLFSVIALVAVVSAQSEINWCAVKTQFCGTNPHIACLPNNFTPTGLSSEVKSIVLTQAQKDIILKAHNSYRNDVAGGVYANISFPAAAKMGEMKWDNTLQYVAEKHAAYGEFKHDACRATPAYRYSGQNLFISMSSINNINVDSAVSKACVSWFDEIKIANPALVDKFLMDHLAAGHFTVMVNDKNNFLGCAASTFKYQSSGRSWFSIMLTCNYQYTNMLNSATYVRGTPCSSCTCSQTYRNLCAAA